MMAEQSQDLRLRDSFASLDNNAWALGAIAIVFVGLRFWCRCNGTRRLWWDDYLLVISLLLLIAAAAIFKILLDQTYKPTDTLLPSSPQTILYLSIFHVLSALSQAFSKTSIVATFLRLTSGAWRVSLWISLIVFDGILLAHTFAAWMRDCNVTVKQSYRLQSKCIPAKEAWFLRCLVPALSFFFDIFLAALPWKIVKNLRLQRHEKIGLAISMSLGVVAGGAALARLILWLRLDDQPAHQGLRYQLDLVLWNFIEPAVSIIAATLPMLRTLVADLRQWWKDRHMERLFQSWRNRNSRLPDIESLENGTTVCDESHEGRRTATL